MALSTDGGASDTTTGRWVSHPPSLYITNYLYCKACGAMLYRDYWLSGNCGVAPYCSPDCEALESRVSDLYALYAGRPGDEATGARD